MRSIGENPKLPLRDPANPGNCWHDFWCSPGREGPASAKLVLCWGTCEFGCGKRGRKEMRVDGQELVGSPHQPVLCRASGSGEGGSCGGCRAEDTARGSDAFVLALVEYSL